MPSLTELDYLFYFFSFILHWCECVFFFRVVIQALDYYLLVKVHMKYVWQRQKHCAIAHTML